MSLKISLLHATRGRHKQAVECKDKWLAAASEPQRIEHIFGIDDDDLDSLVNINSDRVIVPRGQGCVSAWNACAAKSTGDILVQMSDDWEPVPGWDTLISKEFENEAGECVLAISDGARADDLLCMAILNRARYNKYGYLFHPKFLSVYSDNFFTWQAKKDKVLKDAKHIVFEHKHPVWNKAEWDKTYNDSNAPERYSSGLMRYLELTRPDKSTICLAMIVKNEADNIEACLASVKDHIDYWIICDTGSTDGTQKLIKRLMKSYGIRGELHEHPWVNFAENRTRALKLARSKADYTLVIDADDRLEVGNNGHTLKGLKYDQYHFKIVHGELTYFRAQLFRNEYEWSYKGVLHEFLAAPTDVKLLPPVIMPITVRAAASATRNGFTGNKKYMSDALILERALLEEEEESMRARYTFYLAQSYRDAGEHKKALEAYEKRVEQKGWEEEVYYSLYMIGRLKIALKYSEDEIINSLIKAWEYRSSRVDALYDLIRYLKDNNRLTFAFALATIGMRIPPTKDVLFVRQDIHHWRMIDDYSILALQTGNAAEAVRAGKAMISSPAFATVPANEQERIRKNLEAFQSASKAA